MPKSEFWPGPQWRMVRVCVSMRVCSLGLGSLRARLDVDALCAQDCGSKEVRHAVASDTFWRSRGCL